MAETDGPVAIVTGGASGIGLATCRVLLAQGWRIVCVDRDAKAISEARPQLPLDGRVWFAEGDVTDEARVAEIVANAKSSVGRIKGLVTCAGIARDTPFLETTVDDFRRINEVNVVGTFIISREVAKAMRASGGGAIVTIASVSGLLGNIGRSAYGASKGAVVNLTRVMATELARYGIRVNSVAPGPVETPMVAAVHTPAMRDVWHERLLMDRYGTPSEIGEAVAFLLDEKRSAYITGQVLAVDGGFLAAGVIDKARG